jgi:uncharacterized phage protein gp47/JayE
MSGPRAYGLEWSEAEIPGGWQGIIALRFAAAPPLGLAAELIATLAKPADGLAQADLQLVAPDGGPLAHAVTPITDGDLELHIGFAERGPRGEARLRLISGGNDPLHPFFAEAGFDFFIDCPTGDCRAGPPPAPAGAAAVPAVDLATKDFAGFVEATRNWALATDPGWSDLSPASAEQMLIELLAHHAEMLSLHQDRVAQEAFIDTARERLSLRRHAAFLGLSLDEGASAAALVAVDVAPGRSGYLRAGARFVRQEELGRITAAFVADETVLVDARWNAGLGRASDRGVLRPAAWPGAPDAVVPQGTRSLLLLDQGHGLLPGQWIGMVQGVTAHIARLTRIEEIAEPGWAEDPAAAPSLSPRKVTLLEWDAPTPAGFAPWIDPVGRPFLVTANIVPARHGDPREAANAVALRSGVVPLGAGRRDLVVASDPVTGERQIRALRTPEDAILVEPDGRPALRLVIGDDAWDWQPTLWNSAGFDRHYTTEREEDGSVWLLFGDGRRGRAVPEPAGTSASAGLAPAGEQAAIRIFYRCGVAEDGNLGAFALTSALEPLDADGEVSNEFGALGLRAATNPLPATGGRAAVSMDVARQLIPESIRNPALERCVTAEDYARAAEAVPGVAQAAAKPLGGIFNTVAILCAPEEGDVLTVELANAVHAHIDRLRMAGREHVVRPPDYVPLDIAVLICPHGEAGAEAIRVAVRDALAPGTDARPGLFHRSRLGFGAEITLADILAAVAKAPGVGAVKALAFRPLFEAGGEAVRRAIALAPTEIAQFAADEAHPERGRLTVRVQGVDRPEPPGFVVEPAPQSAGGSP